MKRRQFITLLAAAVRALSPRIITFALAAFRDR
jgi:hypothetical protein